MLIEVLGPLCIRRSTGDLHLKPGFLVEIPDEVALQLIAKRPDVVRRVSLPTGYCATCRAVFWIRVDHRADWRCGRCHPSEVIIDSITGRGGSPPPVPVPSASTLTPKRRPEIEPAAPNARAIYWETGTGEILGPAVPEYLLRDGDTFWIVTTFEGQIRWINADRLRSR